MSDQVFISVPTAGRRVFGLSKAQSYQYANQGLIPVVRVGRRVLVPVAALEQLTAEIATGAVETAAVNWRQATGAQGLGDG